MSNWHWFEIPILPLRWIEQAGGRRRLALLSLYALVLSVGGVLIGRETILWELPAAPEPFDLGRYGHVDLPDADNAMVLYTRAAALLPRGPNGVALPPPPGGGSFPWDQWDWPTAAPVTRGWLDANPEVLDTWRRATRRPDALPGQPHAFDRSGVALMSEFQLMAQLGELEATRRQAAGDLAGAWADHIGVIRSAWHAGRHSGIRSAETGGEIVRRAIPLVTAWVDDGRQTPDLLRQAAVDLRLCRALRPGAADLIRVEYFRERADLRDPALWRWRGPLPADPDTLDAWIHHLPGYTAAFQFLRNEPKRSQKILRLITAGMLAQIERPVAERPPIVAPGHMIFAIDAATPAPLTRITPARLAAWADASGAHDAYRDVDWSLGRIQAAVDQVDQLAVAIAARAHRLDHAGQAPETYGDLLGPYLDALPAGLAADDVFIAP